MRREHLKNTAPVQWKLLKARTVIVDDPRPKLTSSRVREHEATILDLQQRAGFIAQPRVIVSFK